MAKVRHLALAFGPALGALASSRAAHVQPGAAHWGVRMDAPIKATRKQGLLGASLVCAMAFTTTVAQSR